MFPENSKNNFITQEKINYYVLGPCESCLITFLTWLMNTQILRSMTMIEHSPSAFGARPWHAVICSWEVEERGSSQHLEAALLPCPQFSDLPLEDCSILQCPEVGESSLVQREISTVRYNYLLVISIKAKEICGTQHKALKPTAMESKGGVLVTNPDKTGEFMENDSPRSV